jgi:hypothetical protein
MSLYGVVLMEETLREMSSNRLKLERDKTMRKKLLAGFVTGAVMTCAVATQASLDYSSLPGSEIVFGPGSQFTVSDSVFADSSLGDGAAQFQVTSTGAGSGLFGSFSGGPWNYGPITINGGLQTANVTTPGGSFAIDDGSGHLLTGNVNWVQVFTLGATGGLNAGASINITDLSYSGSNAALLALLSTSGTGSMDLSFQFATAESLTQLSDGATIGTSYSGSLTAVPEPATIFACLLLLFPLGLSTIRILRKNCLA